MPRFKTYTFAASLIVSMMSGPFAMAQNAPVYEDHVLADGELTTEELAIVLLTAEKDLTALLEEAVVNVKADVESAGVFGPRAWMVMKDKEIKEVKLADDAAAAPPKIQLHMIRVSLKSLARHNSIDAMLIVYPSTMTKNGSYHRVVALEHEHRLGVSGIKLIPLELSGGEVSFGAPLSQEKPFQIFYDRK
ncbi:hypothetical protein [uncultured Marinobacter sp.]|uniref:hypothetical protein n=1 Tax=uncultured Marinobacter sp. TaxID=187379 RepID=UPI00258F3937|nr:hypothetical protein [uncultured Marinobacter sp.]